jgi:hypothetical protein
MIIIVTHIKHCFSEGGSLCSKEYSNIPKKVTHRAVDADVP